MFKLKKNSQQEKRKASVREGTAAEAQEPVLTISAIIKGESNPKAGVSALGQTADGNQILQAKMQSLTQ